MPQTNGPPHRDMQPISRVTLSEIVGLLKVVEEAGGEADAAEVSQAVDVDLNRMGPVIDAAEFLGLAAAEEGEVRVTDMGRKVISAGMRQRKALLRDLLKDLPAFRNVMDRIRQEARPLARRDVLETIAAKFGSHSAEGMFNALVYWGRYAELLTYDSSTEELGLR